MKKDVIASAVSTAVAGTGTAIQPDQVLQYISIVLTIIATLITIILALRAWWKDAKKDGKITKDEIDEGVKIVSDGVEDIKKHIDSNKKKEEKK